MEKKQVLESIKILRSSSKKKFKQNFDLIINLKNINLKKEEDKINVFHVLPHSKGKDSKVCALVGKELSTIAKKDCDFVLNDEDFPNPKDKKEAKKLAGKYHYFIAQANIMPKVAASFGRVLGPRGKMPNPKAGAVVAPTLPSLKPVVEKFRKMVRLETKNESILRATVGNEDSKDEEIVDNVLSVYNAALHVLPQDQNNIKNVLLKLTMGKPVVIGGNAETKKPEVKNVKV
jgi:large subunit ribosomal protein L1